MPLQATWLETTLGEHVRLASGGTPSKANPDFWNGYTPWVTAKDMKSLWIETTEDKLTQKGAEQANMVAPAGTILMLVRGMTLHHDVPIVRLKVPAAFNQDVKAVIPGPAIDPDYLFYLLRSHKPDLLEAVDAAGHGTGRLASDALNRMTILLPSLPEQRVIHEALKAIDEKVELNAAMVSTLEETARALYQSWFVDFDPVLAKAEGRDPTLPADIAALFPDRFGEDGLPEGWRSVAIYDAANVIYGAPFASERFNTLGIGRPLVRIRDLPTHKGGHFTDEVHRKEHVIEPGQIVVGMDGEFRAYLWQGDPALMNQRVCSFKPRLQVNRGYVWLSLIPLLDLCEKSAVGTTVIHLGKKDIDRFNVLSAPAPVHEAFGHVVEAMIDQIVLLGKLSRALVQLRDTLLPLLISGQLRIPPELHEVAAA